MVGISEGFYVQGSTPSSTRVLHPATMLGTQDEGYWAELEEKDLSLEKGREVFVYYEIERRFLKQTARIEAVTDEQHKLTIYFVTVGEPVSAENRQQFRVSTVMSDLTSTLGEETCKLLDVSGVGFSVVSKKRHEIGATLSVEMHHEGQCFSGTVCVQSARSLDKERIRYGLHCVDETHSGCNLAKGLWQITMAVQRQQLRRLAGKG